MACEEPWAWLLHCWCSLHLALTRSCGHRLDLFLFTRMSLASCISHYHTPTCLHNAAQISFQVAGIVLLTLLINGMLAPIVFPRLLPKRDLYVSPELVINALKVWAATTPPSSSTLLTPIATATHSTRMRRRSTTCITCVAPSPASSTSTGALCAT